MFFNSIYNNFLALIELPTPKLENVPTVSRQRNLLKTKSMHKKATKITYSNNKIKKIRGKYCICINNILWNMPGVILFDRTADFPVKYKSFFDTGMGYLCAPLTTEKDYMHLTSYYTTLYF